MSHRHRWPLLLAIVPLVVGAAASTAPADRAREYWLQGLLDGRELSGEARAYAALIAPATDGVGPVEARRHLSLAPNRQRLRAALATARKMAGADRPWLLETGFERFRESIPAALAAHEGFERFAAEVLHRVSGAGLGVEIVRRAEEAAAVLAERGRSIRAAAAELDAVAAAGPKSLAGEHRLRAALERWQALLHEAMTSDEPGAPILRTLPYAERLPAPGPLVVEPAITPSYADPQAAPGGPEALAGSPAAPLSPTIIARAAELGFDYIAIYDFVRQEIRTEYYAGAVKGAERTLETGAGNDVDQASLLIALLRAAKVPARYVHGVVELSLATVAAPLGLPPERAPDALQRGGIPHEPVIRGGQLAALRLAHTWVSAYLPYANYRGAAVDLSGATWLPLAPAVKDHGFAAPALRWPELGLSGDRFVDDYLHGRIAEQPLEAIRAAVADHLAANPGLGSYQDQLARVQVTAPAFSLVPSSLPFVVESVTAEEAALDASRVHHLNVSIPGAAAAPIMDVSVPLPRLLGRRVTLSYQPATVEDYNTIREFGGMALVPAYLVRLRPQLSVEGRPLVSATGTVPMGVPHPVRFELTSPAGSVAYQRSLLAGSYAALGLGAAGGTARVEALAAPVPDDREFQAARVLGNLGAIYGAVWDQAEAELAGLIDVALVRAHPSLAVVASEFAVEELGGLPFNFDFTGATLDAGLRAVAPLARTGEASREYDFLRLAGLEGSALEARVFADQWVVEAVSADRALRTTALAGQAPVELNPSNASSLLPTLNHPANVIEDIQAWIDTGFRVLAAPGPVRINAWEGSAWHVWDPASGGAGYFISGGYAGGQTSERVEDWLLTELIELLANPYGELPNGNPLAAAEIVKLATTDFQLGTVGEPLERPLVVLVRDAGGRPVVGTPVSFRIVTGDAELGEEAAAGRNFEVPSDRFGIARAPLTFGTSTAISRLGHDPDAGEQPERTRFGEVIVAVSALSALGTLQLEVPFTALARPAAPERLEVMTDFSDRALPRGPGGDLSFRVLDRFGNPVSNVTVELSGGMPHECGVPIPAPPAGFILAGDCPPPAIPGDASCAVQPLSAPSGPDSKRIWVVQGDGGLATAYPIRIRADGLAEVDVETANMFQEVACASPDPVIYEAFAWVSERFEKGRRGGSIEAAPPGQPLPRERRARLFSMIPVDESANGLSIRWAVGRAQGQVVYAPEALGEVLATDAGDGEHLAPLVAGADVGGYSVERRAVQVHLQTREDDTFLGGFEERVGPLSSAPLYAASARIIGVSPEPLLLSADGYLLEEMVVGYEVLPEEYLPEIEIRMYEDGKLFHTHRRPTGPNRGTVVFPPGLLIDIEKDYELEVVLSADTDFELSSERVPVPVTQSIVKRVNNLTTPDFTLDLFYGGGIVVNGRVPSSLYVSNHIDIPNQLVCENRDFSFELSIPATVTVTAERLDAAGAPTGDVRELLARTSLARGEHLVEVTATELGTGDFLMLIEAESGVDGSREAIPVGLRSRFELTNSLPVGHAMVKGVDLYDGAMVLSRQDFEVPGLGSPLRFVRTYSSNARFTPGVLGSGWSHNYLSRVIQSHCGDFTVTGAEGGSMRFVRDGTGFRPLKGYHGSLVQNADSSFDFYPKGGNRYHFRKRQSRVWWLEYIEDPNGNRTHLTYVDQEVAPLIRQVTDPSGRALIFDYEYREFDQLRGDVLVKVRGPGGIELSLNYDQFGNLIRAAREEGSLVETYDYRVDAGAADRHLIKAATDVLTGSTREYYYQEQTLVTPIGSYPLDLSASSVASIVEPDGGRTAFSYTPGPGGTFMLVEVTDARGQPTVYELNGYGAATRINAPNGVRTFDWETETDVLLKAEVDENGRRRAFRYDRFGNVIEERIGEHVRGYAYHDPDAFQPPHIKNRVATYSDWRGLVTSSDYDAAGNLLAETLDGIARVHTYDARGNRLSTTDGNGNTTFFNYDLRGFLVGQTDPEGNRIDMRWDVRGRKTEEIDANGNRMSMSYDDRDRIRAKIMTLTLSSGGGAGEFSERFIYEDAARRRTEIDRNGAATVYDHDSMGRLLGITNALGDTFEYRYDGNGNKTLERDWLGRETVFEYDPANRLIRKSEPEGTVTGFAYDPVGNLVREETSGSQESARITEYAYDPDRYFQTEVRRLAAAGDAVIRREYDGEGELVREVDPLGRATEFAYDAYRRRILQQGPLGSGKRFEYDPAGNLIAEVTFNSPNDQIRQFLYDRANRQTHRIDAEGGVTTFEYDGNGNVIREIDPRGHATSFGYNEANLVLDKVQPYTPLRGDATHAVTRFEYDANGSLVAEIWPNGNRVEHVYDRLNRKIAERDSMGPIVTYGYDAAGNVTGETDGNGNTANYRYDGLNRRTEELRPAGRDRQFAYTVFGDLRAETDADGNRISHTIDALGRRVATVGPLGLNLRFEYDLADNLLRETDGRGTTTDYHYNGLNQRIGETVDGLGETFVRAFSYDLVGNRLTETDRRGIVSAWAYDRENRLISFQRDGRDQEARNYDVAGNLLVLTDANGNAIGYRYDERNLVIEEARPELQITGYVRDAAGDVLVEDRPGARDVSRTYDLRRRLIAETNAAGETESFDYDANNNRIARARPESSDHRWAFHYDAANRLESVEDPLGHETRYAYDARDNRIAQVDANGRTTAFEYDARNRQIARVYPDGVRIEFGYDVNNNLRSVSEPNGNQADYEYDVLNRQVGQVFESADQRIEVAFELDGNANPVRVDESTGGAVAQTTRDYDGLDQVTRVTDRFGQTLQYAYDENGNRTALLDHRGQRTEYRYDGLNRLVQLVVPGVGRFDYGYQDDGLIDEVSHPNGSRTSYEYDGAGRIAAIHSTQSGETVTLHVYEYDRNGNRIELREQNGQGLEVTSYTYDVADRLTGVAYPQRDVGYTLDPVGNRIEEVITDRASNQTNVRDYAHNARDQLVQITDTAGQSIDYGYDENGNQIARIQDGETVAFEYSPRNRMIRAKVADQTLVAYRYDHNGLRVQKDVGGASTRYVNDEAALIAETNVLGNTLARYHYGSDRLLAEVRETGHSFFLEDSLGTPVALTTQDGIIRARYTYDAWGNLVRQQGTSEQPFGFTGYQRDEETDLYYAEQRYYDASAGRFTREDPFQGDINTPPSLHRYLYANANPTVFVDPTGQYNEVGHYYTTLYVALRLGYSVRDSVALAFFSQLPDEIDNLDAIATQSGAIAEGLGNILSAWAGVVWTNAKQQRDIVQPAIHSLTSEIGEEETRLTVGALDEVGQDLPSIGLLLHRLGDSFAHRRLQSPSRSRVSETNYQKGSGHFSDGTRPDDIQVRPELYREFVGTLAKALGEKRKLSPTQIEQLSSQIQKELADVANIALHVTGRGQKFEVDPAKFQWLQAAPAGTRLRTSEELTQLSIAAISRKILGLGVSLDYAPEELPGGLREIAIYVPFLTGKTLAQALNDLNKTIAGKEVTEAEAVNGLREALRALDVARQQGSGHPAVIGEGAENSSTQRVPGRE